MNGNAKATMVGALAVAAALCGSSGARAEIMDVETGMIASERLALAVGVLGSGRYEVAAEDDDVDRDRVSVDVNVNRERDDDDDDDAGEIDDDRDDDDDDDEDRPERGPSAGGIFTDAHRTAARQYFQKPGGDCPAAGLEVREDGVCGPIESERVWAIGKPLSDTIKLSPVPAPLMGELPAAGPRRAYGLINGDIVLYDTTSRVVIDAVSWDS